MEKSGALRSFANSSAGWCAIATLTWQGQSGWEVEDLFASRLSAEDWANKPDSPPILPYTGRSRTMREVVRWVLWTCPPIVTSCPEIIIWVAVAERESTTWGSSTISIGWRQLALEWDVWIREAVPA